LRIHQERLEIFVFAASRHAIALLELAALVLVVINGVTAYHFVMAGLFALTQRVVFGPVFGICVGAVIEYFATQIELGQCADSSPPVTLVGRRCFALRGASSCCLGRGPGVSQGRTVKNEGLVTYSAIQVLVGRFFITILKLATAFYYRAGGHGCRSKVDSVTVWNLVLARSFAFFQSLVHGVVLRAGPRTDVEFIAIQWGLSYITYLRPQP